MSNRVNVGRYLYGLISAANNSFYVKNIIGLESAHSEGKVAKIGSNSPITNRVKV